MRLETVRLRKHFGGLIAVSDLSLTLSNGEILGLIGPNGAGKTTVLNLISGWLRPSRGKIILDGKEIGGLPGHKISCEGITRTFQMKNTFSTLSVLENVILSLNLHKRASISRTFTGLFVPSFRKEEEEIRAKSLSLLSGAGLGHDANLKAGSLPPGKEKLLGLIMATAKKPKALLLDEPVAGMMPEEMLSYMSLVVKYTKEMDLGVIVVEHNMKAIMTFCSKIVVLHHGTQISYGTPEEIRSDPKVQEAYLGRSS